MPMKKFKIINNLYNKLNEMKNSEVGRDDIMLVIEILQKYNTQQNQLLIEKENNCFIDLEKIDYRSYIEVKK